MTFVTTRSGKDIKILEFSSSDVDVVDDILRPLSYLCRFNGQCGRFYSVLEHSLLVTNITAALVRGTDLDTPETLLKALLHDAAEAYIGDVIKPLKEDHFKRAEHHILSEIGKAHGIKNMFEDVVKKADNMALYLEWRTLMPTPSSRYEIFFSMQDPSEADSPVIRSLARFWSRRLLAPAEPQEVTYLRGLSLFKILQMALEKDRKEKDHGEVQST